MKLLLTKELKPFQFQKLTWFTFDDLDPDMVLPPVFGLIRTAGIRHQANKQLREDKSQITPTDYIKMLARDERVSGFDGDFGEEMLYAWVYSTIAKVGSLGKKRKTEGVQFLHPIHMGMYSACLPSQPQEKRDADLAVYGALTGFLHSVGQTNPTGLIRDAFTLALGQGVNYGTPQDSFRPRVIDNELDINTLLGLYFAELFELRPLEAGAREARTAERINSQHLVQKSIEQLGRELYGYTVAYSGRLPVSMISSGLVAQISLGLFRNYLQLAHSLNALQEGKRGDEALCSPAELEIFCDLTGEIGSDSDELARDCTNRDLSVTPRLFRDVQFVKILALIAVNSFDDLALENKTPQSMCEFLLDQVKGTPEVNLMARQLIREIKKINTEGDSATCDVETFDALIAHLDDPLEKLVTIACQRGPGSGASTFIKWFRTTGGLTKNYGILKGNLRGKRNWRYSMSDELLSVLVQQSFIIHNQNDPLSFELSERISLDSLLKFLENNYGILINRPPAGRNETTDHKSAANNLDALKKRLQQMGYFEALSDDFAAQYLRNPYHEVRS